MKTVTLDNGEKVRVSTNPHAQIQTLVRGAKRQLLHAEHLRVTVAPLELRPDAEVEAEAAESVERAAARLRRVLELNDTLPASERVHVPASLRASCAVTS